MSRRCGCTSGRDLPVRVATVSLVYPSQVNAILRASGYVVEQRRASIASKATGRLVFQGVEEGDRVKEGQVVAMIESGPLSASGMRTEAASSRKSGVTSSNSCPERYVGWAIDGAASFPRFSWKLSSFPLSVDGLDCSWLFSCNSSESPRSILTPSLNSHLGSRSPRIPCSGRCYFHSCWDSAAVFSRRCALRASDS